MTVVHTPGNRLARVGAIVVVVALVTARSWAAQAPAEADGGVWGPSVPGEFIAELERSTDAAQVNAEVGGIAAPERLVPGSRLFRFRLAPSVAQQAGVDRLTSTDGVVQAQPNVLADVSEFFGGRRSFWGDWELADTSATRSAYRVTQPGLGHAGLPATSATGAGVVVAVLDTGIAPAHSAFTSRIAPGGYDVVGRDASPTEARNNVDDNGNGLVDEAYGHGTYVAGIVALVAPRAHILPVRVLDTDGSTTAFRVLQGVERAVTADADVLNLSLGGTYLGTIVEQRFERLLEDNVLVVAAAGNEATVELRYPAAAAGVLGVTAVDGRDGLVADFANTGSWIDIAAPGVRIVSAWPGGRYATWGGTSAAAPVAAGAIALVRQLLPTAPGTDVVDRLTATARPDGLPNVSAYGRIDVSAAVAQASGSK